MYDTRIRFEAHCPRWIERRRFYKQFGGEPFPLEILLRYEGARAESSTPLVRDLNELTEVELGAGQCAEITRLSADNQSGSLWAFGVELMPVDDLDSTTRWLAQGGWQEDSEARAARATVTHIDLITQQRCLPLTQQEKDFECEQLDVRMSRLWDDFADRS